MADYPITDWRDRIRPKLIIAKLMAHLEAPAGEEVLSPTQIKAAEILLRKVLPDLKAIEHSGEVLPPRLVIDMRPANYREPIEAEVVEVKAVPVRKAPPRPAEALAAPPPAPDTPRGRGRPRAYPEGYLENRRKQRALERARREGGA
jgi:hypothetical protein